MHIQVDVQIDETTPLNLMGMSCALKIFLAIVPGTNAKGLETDDF